jgi:hypothetical protein
MLLTMLLALLQTAAPVVSPPPADLSTAQTAPTADKCPSPMHRADNGRPPSARRLDDLPPGRLELTVLQMMPGTCPQPVVLREGIGGNPNAFDAPRNDRR